MEKLSVLLERLKARQREIIMGLAEHDMMPPDSAVTRIAELENAIAAVEAVVDEAASKRHE